MNKLHQFILFINSFSLGILLPVFNLILLQKGSNLQTLPLLMGIYSITVLSSELPSGICADIFGRKFVFLLACSFQILSFSLLIVGNSLVWLIFALIFFGLGRAFSSGSIDALIIDNAMITQGDICLAKVTARMALLDGTGLAVGSIAGGFLAYATGSYSINVILRLVLTAVTFLICLLFIQEHPKKALKEESITLLGHLRQGKQLLSSTPIFRALILGVFFAGFFLSAVETYWQPAFMQIQSLHNNNWILGFVAFLGFIALVLGNTGAEKLLNRSRDWFKVYNFSRIILAACILFFSLQTKSGGFMMWFFLIYLILGASNVTENTLLNKYTPSAVRASMLSLISFTVQIGALISSIFSSLTVTKLHFTGIWIFAGGLLGVYAVIVTVIFYKSRKEMVTGSSV